MPARRRPPPGCAARRADSRRHRRAASVPVALRARTGARTRSIPGGSSRPTARRVRSWRARRLPQQRQRIAPSGLPAQRREVGEPLRQVVVGRRHRAQEDDPACPLRVCGRVSRDQSRAPGEPDRVEPLQAEVSAHGFEVLHVRFDREAGGIAHERGLSGSPLVVHHQRVAVLGERFEVVALAHARAGAAVDVHDHLRAGADLAVERANVPRAGQPALVHRCTVRAGQRSEPAAKPQGPAPGAPARPPARSSTSPDRA